MADEGHFAKPSSSKSAAGQLSGCRQSGEQPVGGEKPAKLFVDSPANYTSAKEPPPTPLPLPLPLPVACAERPNKESRAAARLIRRFRQHSLGLRRLLKNEPRSRRSI